MITESIQHGLNLITLLAAAITVVVGIHLIHFLSMRKVSGNFSNKWLIIFYFMAFGYALFAAGDLAWYLIFNLLKQAPGVSMPDFYWVLGSFCTLMAFGTLFFSSRIGMRSGMFLLITVAAVAITWFVVNTIIASVSVLGYYYPMVSMLVSMLSLGAYLSARRMQIGIPLGTFVVANFCVTIADIFFSYTSFQQTYGFAGLIADLFYLAGYVLISWAFIELSRSVRGHALGQ